MLRRVPGERWTSLLDLENSQVPVAQWAVAGSTKRYRAGCGGKAAMGN